MEVKIMTTTEKSKDALVYQFPHDLDTVFNEITSEDYINARCKWIGDRADIVKEESAGGGLTIKLDRYVAKNYPKAFKKLFPAEQHMTHLEKWQPDGSNWKGTYHVDVDGAPVVVTSEFTLKKTGIGCDLSIVHAITAKIPILGKRIEKYILGETRAQFGDQLHFLDMKLAGTPNLLPRDKSKYPVPK
jgi:hypothetical protein